MVLEKLKRLKLAVHFLFKKEGKEGRLGAQSVKHPILNLGYGYDLRVVRWSPALIPNSNCSAPQWGMEAA